jgi:hypothetical protein
MQAVVIGRPDKWHDFFADAVGVKCPFVLPHVFYNMPTRSGQPRYASARGPSRIFTPAIVVEILKSSSVIFRA